MQRISAEYQTRKGLQNSSLTLLPLPLLAEADNQE